MKAFKQLNYMNMKRFFVIPFLLLAVLLSSFVAKNEDENDEDKFVVVLDAGHGGHDPGNLGNGYLEKNIALNIVLKVGAILDRDWQSRRWIGGNYGTCTLCLPHPQ